MLLILTCYLLALAFAVSKSSNNGFNEDETGGVSDDKGADQSVVKLTKAERRAKLKKSKKEAKKQVKEVVPKTEDVEQLPRAEVLVLALSSLYTSFLMNFAVVHVYVASWESEDKD